jgi:hypothetical protein
MTTNLDQDALDTLTPEERAAMEESDYSDGDMDAIKKIAGQDDDEDDDSDDADDESSDDEEQPDDQDDQDDQEAAQESSPEPVEAIEAAAPRYEAKLPSDYDDQIKGLKERDAALRQQFKDGDIDIDERDAGLAELSEQREQLLVARAKAEISQEMTQQTAAQQWQNTVNKALSDFAKPEQGGIDYRKDTAKAADLDAFVKFLANKDENNDKPMEWFLSEAHKRVQALYGVTPVKRETVDEVKAKRKPSLGSVPKTLAQVPGSDGPGDVASEFADVEALGGWDLEQAIARMSPSQRAKFLAG